MAGGWVKAHRSMVDHPALQQDDAYGVWIRLIQMAQRAPRKINWRGQSILLETGEVAISVRGWSRQRGTPHKRLRGILERFTREGMIQEKPILGTVKGTGKGTVGIVITIRNYGVYQQPDEEQGTAEGTAEGTSRAQWGHTKQEREKERITKKASRSPPSGSRLPADWSPSEIDLAYARKQGFANGRIEGIAENFRDYWIAKPGAAGRKSDWAATWRTWVRREAEKSNGSGLSSGERGGPGGHPSDARGRAGPGSVAEAGRRLLHRQN